MTRRAPHPALAALYRAGGSIQRAADAFEQAQDAGAFTDISLEDHALASDPVFQDLLAGQGAVGGVKDALARLAQGGTVEQELISRHSSDGTFTDSVQATEPTVSDPPVRPKGEFLQTLSPVQLQSKKTNAEALKATHRALRQVALDTPETPRDRPHNWAKTVRHSPKTKPTQVSIVGKRTWAPQSNIAAKSAQRPVAHPMSAAQKTAIQQILQGDPVTLPDGTAVDAAPELKASSARIEQALSKLGVSSSRSDTYSPPANKSVAPEARAPIQMSTDPQPEMARQTHVAQPQRAPRNGIERLLQKAREQNLISVGQPEGGQAALSPETTETPDLAVSQRPNPTAEPVPAPSPESMAEALTDLIRREARAAGIDLNGGRK